MALDTHLSNLNLVRFSPFVIKRHEMTNEWSPQMMRSPTLFLKCIKCDFEEHAFIVLHKLSSYRLPLSEPTIFNDDAYDSPTL